MNSSFSRSFLLCITILVAVLSLSSCIKRTYRVQVENRTKYELTQLIVRMHSADTISLRPYETSEELTLTYTSQFPLNLFAEGGLTVWPHLYTYGELAYKNDLAPYWTKSAVKCNELVKIVITECLDSMQYCYGPFSIKAESGISF